MERLYSRFPGGGVGFGLLLLRLILAVWFFETGIPMFGTSPITFAIAVVLVATALLLIAGAETSTNATVGAVCLIIGPLLADKPDQWFHAFSLAAISISVALLGPGGYSLDARLSGWRTVVSTPTSRNNKETL